MLPNEERADRGAQAVAAASVAAKSLSDDVATAVSDTLADILHFCDRVGLDGAEIQERGTSTYEGDLTEAPSAKRRGHPTSSVSEVAVL